MEPGAALRLSPLGSSAYTPGLGDRSASPLSVIDALWWCPDSLILLCLLCSVGFFEASLYCNFMHVGFFNLQGYCNGLTFNEKQLAYTFSKQLTSKGTPLTSNGWI